MNVKLKKLCTCDHQNASGWLFVTKVGKNSQSGMRKLSRLSDNSHQVVKVSWLARLSCMIFVVIGHDTIVISEIL